MTPLRSFLKLAYGIVGRLLRKFLPYLSFPAYTYFELGMSRILDLFKRDDIISLPLKKPSKNHILILTSYLYVGGVENLLDLLLKHLPAFHFVVVVDTYADEKALAHYRWKHLYVLDKTIKDSCKLDFIRRLIKHYHFEKILITNSLFAYASLPKLRDYSLPVIDILHVQMRENFFLYLAKLYDSFIDKHVAVSDSLRDYLIQHLHLSSTKVLAISNAIDYDHRFNPRQLKRTNKRTKFIVSFFGRLYYDKDPFKFLHIAFRLLDQSEEFFFTIVGDGILKEKMMQRIALEGREHFFHFYGALSYPEEVIINSDLVVITSHHEGLPFAALESIALGTPVITPRFGSLDELVIPQVNGCLLDDSRVNSYVQLILAVYKKTLVFHRATVRNSLPARFKLSHLLYKYQQILSKR